MAMTTQCEETRSETTSNSTSDDRCFMSREERDEVARLLCIPEEDVVQEKFRVNRRRMEQLMFGHAEGTAVNFFESIQKDTHTVISWPTRLKANATSKKDPYIYVQGRLRNVQDARCRIVEGLDSEIRKVTLKIDVSYTDHSHIIGRGGNTIKAVMTKTGCHIHFPDCNRSNQHEKSNMVSISGELDRVEMARSKVRELIPLVFSFDLPVLGAVFMPLDEHGPYINSIKDTYNVQVFFRTKQKLNSTLVLVKGSGTEYKLVKEATEKLINHFKTPTPEQVQIHSTIEISPNHHNIVRGQDNCNLNLIKASTGTQITFPDLQDPNIPSIKRSNVIITGYSIHCVYLALQFIIGSLPVTFAFDVPLTAAETERDRIRQLNQRHDVQISTKLRSKSGLYMFVIKGVERNMGNIYEAYRALTPKSGCALPIPKAVPTTYILPGAQPYNLAISLLDGTRSPISTFMTSSTSPLSLSPGIMHLSPTSPLNSSSRQTSHGAHHKQLFSDLGFNPPFLQQPFQNLWPPHPFVPLGPPGLVPERDQGRLSLPVPVLQQEPQVHSSVGSNISSPRHSPTPSPGTWSPTPSIHLPIDDSNFLSGKPACSSPTGSSGSIEHLKQNALLAMKKKVRPSELRIPTPVWAGFGFSHSSPTHSLQGLKRSSDCMARSDDGDDWLTLASGASGSSESLPLSNILDVVGSSVVETVSSVDGNEDLHRLLASVGLEKYFTCFQRHEATDLDIFMSFSETDLVTIGINTLGARKKLLLLITELNSRRNTFRTSPGAERKKRRNEMWWPES